MRGDAQGQGRPWVVVEPWCASVRGQRASSHTCTASLPWSVVASEYTRAAADPPSCNSCAAVSHRASLNQEQTASRCRTRASSASASLWALPPALCAASSSSALTSFQVCSSCSAACELAAVCDAAALKLCAVCARAGGSPLAAARCSSTRTRSMSVARWRVDSASPPDPEAASGATTVTIRTDLLPKTNVPPGPQQAR